jgi:uncharacterized membrane protein
MDHDGYWGAGRFGGAPGAGPVPTHPWMGLLFMGISLAWLLGPLLITMAYLWYHNRRVALASHAPVDGLIGDDPSALELLRRRYVVGEIDTPTFEEMTERLLLSERAEERYPAAANPARFARYLRRAPQPEASGADRDSGSEPRVIWL